MMKTRRVVLTTVLAGLALALMAGDQPATANQAAQAQEDNGQPRKETKGKALNPLKTDEVLVKIFNQGAGCGHDVIPPMTKPKLKKNHDDLGWDITNTCSLDQKVLLCAYDTGNADNLFNPFHPCKNRPTIRDVEKTFTVARNGGRARLDCTGRDVGDYLKVILVGREVPISGCPASPPSALPKPDAVLTHRLGVEIIQ